MTSATTRRTTCAPTCAATRASCPCTGTSASTCATSAKSRPKSATCSRTTAWQVFSLSLRRLCQKRKTFHFVARLRHLDACDLLFVKNDGLQQTTTQPLFTIRFEFILLLIKLVFLCFFVGSQIAHEWPSDDLHPGLHREVCSWLP